MTAPVAGTSEFAKQFAAAGPKDSKGRSLRDFELRTRLFKFPCSYLIYSKAFDELPGALKDVIYKRLFEILTGEEEGFDALRSQSKSAILDIVRDTKPGLPMYWKEAEKE